MLAIVNYWGHTLTGCPRIENVTNLGGSQTLPEGEIVASRGVFESFFLSTINSKSFSDSLSTFNKSMDA